MIENRNLSISELLMALLSLFFSGVVGIGSKNKKKDKKVKLKGYQGRPKATTATFLDQVQKMNEGSVQIEDSMCRVMEETDSESDQSESEEEVNVVCENEKKNPEMNGSQTKPKAKVTFEDQVQSNKDTVLVDSPKLGEPTKSHEVEEKEPKPAEDSLVLSPRMADLMLSYLDTMNIRMVHCECTTAYLLKDDIAGAQARLNLAKRMLDDIPASMSSSERKAYMLEICQYVESIFSSLEKLAIKMVKCHGDTMCEIIQEFDENVKMIESDAQKQEKVQEDEKSDRDKALRFLEMGVVGAFFVLTAFIAYLLTRPDIGRAFGGFLVRAFNSTFNSTNKTESPTFERNSSALNGLGNLVLPYFT